MKTNTFILVVLLTQISQRSFAELQGNFTIQSVDFKSLFNNHRLGQPNPTPWAGSFFPYSDNGTAVKLSTRPGHEYASPMESYDQLVGWDQNYAEKWEAENHTCEKLAGSLKESCESWWGHCNGWAAAAIKVPEPRGMIRVGEQMLTVADQKGIFTELWLSTYSINVGATDKNKKTGTWVLNADENSKALESFWDVSPRTMFLTFTNYIGIQKTGLVIDRNTGDEVWNQPVVGYRLLPIEKKQIVKVKEGDTTYWKALIHMKIFWANDIGIDAHHVSKPFDIERQTTDSAKMNDSLSRDYEGRLLSFYLMFDAPLLVSENGLTVLSAGRLIGPGLWNHYEEAKQKNTYAGLDNTHPDFIWLPTSPFLDLHNGYGNPYVKAELVEQIRNGKPVGKPRSLRKLKQSINRGRWDSAYESAEPKMIFDTLSDLLVRWDIHSRIIESTIKADESVIRFTVEIVDPSEENAIKEAIESVGVGEVRGESDY